MSIIPHTAFSVIEDNELFIVIDKSPGISFHSESGDPGLFEQVKSALSLNELYPVHRLDKITSGLMLLAKTKQSASDLSELFRLRQVSKFYLAISDKKPKKKQGLIKGDVEASRRGSWKLCKSKENPAITQFFSHSIKPGMRLYLLKPHTGKTHQIRISLKSLSAPIVGDMLYHNAWEAKKFDRGYLHAYGLSFSLHDVKYAFIAPPSIGSLFLDECTQKVIQEQYASPGTLPWPTL
ncbi:MAG: TIGR01621 family pseudouridine synthase [Pseudomonadales bacterium]|nr:TIGR01621 family pseudouridine synthase [Pseudomonadales bacterium]